MTIVQSLSAATLTMRTVSVRFAALLFVTGTAIACSGDPDVGGSGSNA
jgi:hypothetical protein